MRLWSRCRRLPLRANLEDKHVLIVSEEGRDIKRICLPQKHYIAEGKTSSDWGGRRSRRSIVNAGICQILLSGDMDSVTDEALFCGAELVVHAYADGTAPGMARTIALGSVLHVLPCFGTSEDMALLLALSYGVECLVTVGAHTHMIDFLEKGQSRHGKYTLVRMKVGASLVDIKSIRASYMSSLVAMDERGRHNVFLSLFFIALGLFQLHWIVKRVAHVVWKLGGEG